MGRVVSAPISAFTLAALGAEVVRVDPPDGDLSWSVPPFVGPDGDLHAVRGDDDVAVGHLRRGRGKRSVVLDLRQPDDRDRCLALIASADVVIENARPGSLERLGCGVEVARRLNPALVWCSISGFGQDGPFAERAAIDLTIQAEGGLIERTGWPDRPGVRVGATVVDHLAAAHAVVGILAALRRRDRTGQGATVDVAMLDVLASVLWDEPLDLPGAQADRRQGNRDERGAPHGVYAGRDGEVALVVTSAAQWSQVCELMGRPDLAGLTLAERTAAVDEVDRAVGRWTATRPVEDVAAQLGRLGVPVGVVRSARDLAHHPQLLHRGLLEELRTATGAPSGLLGARVPLTIDGHRPSAAPAEPLGASTRAVLDLQERPDD